MRKINLNKKLKSKAGVSIMIGYVLLVSFAIIMGGIVYKWMKTYVPTDTVECPDGVSAFIREIECDKAGTETEYSLSLNLTNNGRFDMDGFYVRVTATPEQKLATIDISKKVVSGGSAPGNFVQLFQKLSPGEKASFRFSPIAKTYSIEVIPMMFREVEGKIRLASCSDAKVKEIVECE